MLFTCVDIPGEGLRESVWLMARANIPLGTQEMDDWLSYVMPLVETALPVDRMSRLNISKYTTDCVFRVD
jgi:hypothetical protein